MTCKDCINYSSCLERGDVAPKELMEGAEDDCELFKNKSDYAEVKHGEWIEDETHISKRKKKYICSCCLHYIIIKTTTDINSRRYCYECGARMVEDIK